APIEIALDVFGRRVLLGPLLFGRRRLASDHEHRRQRREGEPHGHDPLHKRTADNGEDAGSLSNSAAAGTACPRPAPGRDSGPMIRVQREDFDPGLELARLTVGRTDIGGAVVFCGIVRDAAGAGEARRGNGETIRAMTLEHYPGMTEKKLAA